MMFYKPLQARITTYAAQISAWSQKIRMATVSDAAIRGIEQNVQSLEREIDEIEEKIYYLEDMPVIARDLVNYARRHGLSVTAMTPTYDVLFPVKQVEGDSKPLVKLPVEIEMTGRFVNAGRFIEDVGQLPFAFAPDGVQFSADALIYPRIHIKVKGFLFLLNEEKKPGKKG